jgi:hypothetical protein
MSATRTRITRIACLSGHRFLLARIGVQPRESRCPRCDSIVYSRRQKLCGVCEEALPADCRFSAGEANRVECVLRAELQRHRAWLSRA